MIFNGIKNLKKEQELFLSDDLSLTIENLNCIKSWNVKKYGNFILGDDWNINLINNNNYSLFDITNLFDNKLKIKTLFTNTQIFNGYIKFNSSAILTNIKRIETQKISFPNYNLKSNVIVNSMTLNKPTFSWVSLDVKNPVTDNRFYSVAISLQLFLWDCPQNASAKPEYLVWSKQENLARSFTKDSSYSKNINYSDFPTLYDHYKFTGYFNAGKNNTSLYYESNINNGGFRMSSGKKLIHSGWSLKYANGHIEAEYIYTVSFYNTPIYFMHHESLINNSEIQIIITATQSHQFSSTYKFSNESETLPSYNTTLIKGLGAQLELTVKNGEKIIFNGYELKSSLESYVDFSGNLIWYYTTINKTFICKGTNILYFIW